MARGRGDGGVPGPDAPAAAYREVRRHRGLADVRTLAGYVLVGALGAGLATVAPRTASGAGADLATALSGVPRAATLFAIGALQVLVLVLAAGTPVVLLVTRRFGALGRGALALVLAPLAYAAAAGALDLAAQPADPPSETFPGTDWPPTGVLASYTAVAAVLRPGISPRWRRLVWSLLGVLAVVHLLTATTPSVGVVLAVGVGGAVGSALLLALGRSTQVLTPAGVAGTLGGAGLDVTDLTPASGRPEWDYTARSGDGAVDVKVVDEHDWHRSRLYRAYRRLRLRGMGDDAAFSSPERAVAAEAMLALFARSKGVDVPLVRAIARAPAGEVLLAADAVPGTALADADDAALTDGVLTRCWEQVARLRAARVAHRALHLGSLVLADDGRVWVRDLDLGEPAATDEVLAGDVAELLAATGARVGPQRAVAAAVGVLGPAPLTTAVARLVPVALSAPTRAATKARPDGLRPLVDEVCAVTGVERPRFEDVERIKPRVLVTAVMLAVAVYVLAPQLTDLPGMLATVRDADVRWLVPVLLASAATYVGAALGLAGGTPGRIPVGEAGAVALAASFVATFAPPGVGQVGLNVRYLQKRGFATPVAVSASAAKEAAVLVVHLLLLLIFAVWAGRTGALADELDRLPPAGVVAAVAGAVLVAVGVTLAIPRVRASIRGTVLPAVRSSLDAMHGVVRNPGKIVTLFTGVVFLPLGYAACLYFSLEAFGGGASFAAVALVSLTAGTIAAAAPTPGGVGAVEAVLLAALTGLGVASSVALAAVFLYRFATFWLPIAPGAVAFRALTRREVL